MLAVSVIAVLAQGLFVQSAFATDNTSDTTNYQTNGYYNNSGGNNYGNYGGYRHGGRTNFYPSSNRYQGYGNGYSYTRYGNNNGYYNNGNNGYNYGNNNGNTNPNNNPNNNGYQMINSPIRESYMDSCDGGSTSERVPNVQGSVATTSGLKIQKIARAARCRRIDQKWNETIQPLTCEYNVGTPEPQMQIFNRNGVLSCS